MKGLINYVPNRGSTEFNNTIKKSSHFGCVSHGVFVMSARGMFVPTCMHLIHDYVVTDNQNCIDILRMHVGSYHNIYGGCSDVHAGN